MLAPIIKVDHNIKKSNTIVFVINNAEFFVSHRLPIAIEAVRRGFSLVLICLQNSTLNGETKR
jgi:hypothetical protein